MQGLTYMLLVQQEVLFFRQAFKVRWVVIALIEVNVMAVITIRFSVNAMPTVVPIRQKVREEPAF